MKRSTKTAPVSLSTSYLIGSAAHRDLDDHVAVVRNVLAGRNAIEAHDESDDRSKRVRYHAALAASGHHAAGVARARSARGLAAMRPEVAVLCVAFAVVPCAAALAQSTTRHRLVTPFSAAKRRSRCRRLGADQDQRSAKSPPSLRLRRRRRRRSCCTPSADSAASLVALQAARSISSSAPLISGAGRSAGLIDDRRQQRRREGGSRRCASCCEIRRRQVEADVRQTAQPRSLRARPVRARAALRDADVHLVEHRSRWARSSPNPHAKRVQMVVASSGAAGRRRSGRRCRATSVDDLQARRSARSRAS